MSTQKNKKTPIEYQAVNFHKVIEAIRECGLRVMDIHMERGDESPSITEDGGINGFTGVLVIKTFPINFRLDVSNPWAEDKTQWKKT